MAPRISISGSIEMRKTQIYFFIGLLDWLVGGYEGFDFLFGGAPAWDVNLGADNFHHLGGYYGANFSAYSQGHAK